MKRWASDWLIPRAVALLGAMAVSLSGTSGDWPVYGYDASATRYLSPLNRPPMGFIICAHVTTRSVLIVTKFLGLSCCCARIDTLAINGSAINSTSVTDRIVEFFIT
jgi:hypothetical protein